MNLRDQAQAVRLLRRWRDLSKAITRKCSDAEFIGLSAAWELLRVQTGAFVDHEPEEATPNKINGVRG